MSNLFELAGLEESRANSAPQFVKKSTDEYLVITRFRNQADYNTFADLIGQPHLKKITKTSARVATYPYVNTTASLEDLF